MTYTFTDHLHNYALWTAARAVQRNFTTTKNICSAIGETDLRRLIDRNEIVTIEQFDNFHRQTADIIIKYLKSIRISSTYGQAAKIIAIYLKTAVVIRDSGLGTIAKIAHPPIDNILLTHLHHKYRNLGLKGVKWTQLTEKQYFDLINKLRTLDFDYFWELEQYWTPIQQ